MDAPQLKVSVRSSFDQCLALIVLTCVCCLSLLAWPEFSSFWVFFCFCLFVELFLFFFGYELYQLKSWRCDFSLSNAGDGVLFLNSTSGQQLLSMPHTPFSLSVDVRSLITPLVVVFYIDLLDDSGERRLMQVWADMLDVAQYRHLCRILASCNK